MASPRAGIAAAAAVTRVAVCQLALRLGAVDANRAAARAAIAAAAARRAQVVVLPELTPSGYVFRDRDEARSLAEPADGPTVREWAALAAWYGIVIVGGFCELGESGELRNSAVLIDPDGTRAVYRKAHLWDAEADVFVPGDSAPPVEDTAHGRIGVMICYDAEFPEWVRRPALAGAELLAVPVNWPAEPLPDGERPIVVVNIQAAASANRLFIAAADRCRAERGVSWVSGSVIAGPDGYPLAGPVSEDTGAVLLADCDLGRARSKACGPRNDVHADRRPGLYS
jgi:predicted amidohydrolase